MGGIKTKVACHRAAPPRRRTKAREHSCSTDLTIHYAPSRMADRRPAAPSPLFGIQPPHVASTAMAPPPPQPTSSAEPRGTSPPAAAGSSSSSSSSLLHLLAAASSDLPAKISSSYHLHELPAAGSPRSNTSGTPGVQPAGAEGGASATSNGSGPAGASASGAAGPSGLKRKASSSVGPEEKKEIKNGNNKVTLSCAECRRRASPPSGRLPLVAAYGVDRTARADSRDHPPPPPPPRPRCEHQSS